jgi:preprotein translocase subunit SecA
VFAQIARKLFGSANDRTIKRLVPLVQRVGALEPATAALSDAALQARTAEFRQRLENGEALDALLPEAFASVREAAKRVLGQRHFDVQLIGGAILHEGRIAEMKTGEGKTLVATLPSYLNALSGKGVHVVTVNDYLARRDAEWMGRVHRFLGLSVGCIVHGLDDAQRRAAYAADITYGTNNELGFDYLRDNMKPSLQYFVQRGHHFAIVDEVDSILIDEARTPLIISGPSEENTQLYSVANRVVPRLAPGTKGDPMKGIDETGDFWVDEKDHVAVYTDEGIHKVQQMLGVEDLWSPQMMPVVHALNQALIAHTLKKRDVDYVVKPGESGRLEVVIVDEFTGRLMPGRRWSDGLHQAVEAKEGIPIQSENQTLASITFQNYFRMYGKLAGMTGTADTEAPEFAKIYNLDVVVAPTNRPMIRKDEGDVVYKTKREKFDAAIEEIKECHERGQPVLVGTISIEASEQLSKKLGKRGVRHNVLNAKQHEREAEIIAQAGRKGAVTISTNMAGRGTDIVLGGNAEMLALHKCQGSKEHPEWEKWLAHFEAECLAERAEVVAAGGLHVLGTERHESRRIDNQLRGRSGRQGDPGSSRFYLSLEDDLLRIFGSDRISGWMERLGLQEGEAIEHRFITRAIENAQKKVEARNFDVRKHLLEYDDVMNKQRTAFYERRRALLAGSDVHAEVLEMVEGVLVEILAAHWPEKGEPDEEALAALVRAVEAQFGVALDARQEPFLVGGRPASDRDAIGRAVLERLLGFLEQKARHWDEVVARHSDVQLPTFQQIEGEILRVTLDRLWKDHLHGMDALRESVRLRGYAQKDPKIEYAREGYGMFEEMNARVDQQVAEQVFKMTISEEALERRPPAPRPTPAPAAAQPAAGARPAAAPPASAIERLPGRSAPAGLRAARAAGAAAGAGSAAAGKVGRNDPCPCGSGKKHKKCCGAA